MPVVLKKLNQTKMLNPKIKKVLKSWPLIPRLACALGLGGIRLKVLKALPSHGVGAEIGVHMGEYSQVILDIVRPRKLFLIDPWKSFEDETYTESWYGSLTPQEDMDRRYEHVCSKFRNHMKSGRIEILRKMSYEGLESIENNSLDFVYIDGDHTYEGVKQDIDLSLKKLKKGGFLTGDDYGPGSWWNGGVKKAVDEAGWRDDVSLIWIQGTQFLLKKL